MDCQALSFTGFLPEWLHSKSKKYYLFKIWGIHLTLYYLSFKISGISILKFPVPLENNTLNSSWASLQELLWGFSLSELRLISWFVFTLTRGKAGRIFVNNSSSLSSSWDYREVLWKPSIMSSLFLHLEATYEGLSLIHISEPTRPY